MKTWQYALVLAGLAALGPFTVDTYLPSFPSIARDFEVTALQVQQSLSLYLAALAIASLVHGTLADAFGRRRVLIGTLALFVVSSLGIALAPTFGWLLALRAVQGLVGGAGMIIGRAVIRDRFEGAAAQRLMAQVTMLFGLAPAIAPILGGYLDETLGWRSVFLFLTLLSGALLAMVALVLPETLPAGERQPLRPRPLARGYLEVGRHPGFIALSLSLGMGFGGFLIYVASASDVVLEVLGLGATAYGWLFLPMVGGLVAGSWLAGRLAASIEPIRMIGFGYLLMALAAASNLLWHLFLPAGAPWSLLPLPFYTLGVALQAPAVTLLAIDLFPHRRGLAASLQSFLQTMTFAGLSSLLAPLLFGSGLRYALAMAAMLVLNFMFWSVYRAWLGSVRARAEAVPLPR